MAEHHAHIHVENLRLRTFVGFNPEELEKKQDVVINLGIDYQADLACDTDDQSNALDYKVITKAVIAFVENGQFKLLEKLCADILSKVLSYDGVLSAEVKVEKPHALRFADSVSLTLRGTKYD